MHISSNLVVSMIGIGPTDTHKEITFTTALIMLEK